MSVFDRLGELSQSDTHAFLFYGPEGGSQNGYARDLCRAWMCSNPSREGACGECPNCGSFDRGTHPDFTLVTLWGSGRQIRQPQFVRDYTLKEKDQPPHIPVLDFARTPPLTSRHKVVLIDPVDAMNSAASNSFLKTLEEPPPYLRFALVTSAVSRLLPTIRSRCLGIACESLATEVLKERFGEFAAYAEAFPHLADRFLGDPEMRESFLRLLEDLPRAARGHALRLTDVLRDLADRAAPKDEPARDSMAHALEALACGARVRWPERPDFVEPILEAHRRCKGQGSPGLALDRMFASLS